MSLKTILEKFNKFKDDNRLKSDIIEGDLQIDFILPGRPLPDVDIANQTSSFLKAFEQMTGARSNLLTAVCERYDDDHHIISLGLQLNDRHSGDVLEDRSLIGACMALNAFAIHDCHGNSIDLQKFEIPVASAAKPPIRRVS